MHNIQRPSLVRVIQIDYTAFLAFLFPIVFWGLYVVITLVQPEQAVGFMIGAIVGTVLAIPTLIWRYRLIASVFEYGIETPAIISNISFFRDRGRVYYIYTLDGQKYISSNAVNQTGRTKALKVGEQVTLALDRDHPKRAFIRDLYL